MIGEPMVAASCSRPTMQVRDVLFALLVLVLGFVLITAMLGWVYDLVLTWWGGA
jgi:hypothetical protein